MKKYIWVLVLGLVVLAGCETIKQANEDRKLGMEAPLEAGEIHPKEQARNFLNALSGLPYVGPFMPFALPVVTPIFGWWRGKNKRKNMPVSNNPITGHLGSKIGLEFVTQTATDIITGLAEWGKEGSALKRGIKVGLSTLTGLIVAGFSFPQVQELLISNPEIGVWITALSGSFAAVEKAASKVLPVAPATTVSTQ